MYWRVGRMKDEDDDPVGARKWFEKVGKGASPGFGLTGTLMKGKAHERIKKND